MSSETDASRYSPEGVAELRAKWEVEYARLPMPPPPPEIFPTKEAAIASGKAFARNNGYVLTVGHSYKDKVSLPS